MSEKLTVQVPDLPHYVELMVNASVWRMRVYIEAGQKNYGACNDYSVSYPYHRIRINMICKIYADHKICVSLSLRIYPKYFFFAIQGRE